MDRGRYRALLKTLILTGVVAAGLVAGVGTVRAQGTGSPVPSVAVPPPAPTASATPDAARKRVAEKAMAERRQRELAAQQEAQRRIEQLPPEEREAFKRNLSLWRELSPDEREGVRKEADERIRLEIEKALQESGLHLDKDRQEVFALRYRQERRRMERELQEKIAAERARRLPAILDGLKREFADKAAVPTPPVPAPTSRSTPSVSVPTVSPGR